MRDAAFFGLACLYLWRWVRPDLIYSCGTITNFPAFYRGWSFFQQTVRRPGGPIEYLSALVSQLLEYSWTGAVVIVAQAWAISACTGYLLRAAKLPGARLLRFAPALFVLVAYSRYSYHLPLFMGAAASAALACLYVRLVRPVGGSGARGRDLAIYLTLSIILYILGAAAFLPFALFCAAYEVCRGRWMQSGSCLLIAGVLPYVAGVLVFRISVANAYTELLPVSWRVLGWAMREQMAAAVYGAYLFPVAGVLAGGLRFAVSCVGSRRSEAGAKSAEKPPRGRSSAVGESRTRVPLRWARRPAVQWTAGTLVLFAAGGATAVLAQDARQKALLEVHHYACRRMWPETLDAARRCPDSLYAMNAVNRALYHTGRLGADMFWYVQQPDGLLITGEDRVVLYWHAFDTLLDLGLANLAEKNFMECLEVFGEHPLILERLATANLMKGKTAAARVYLGRLAKTLFHSRWASDCLSRLEADPNLANDPELQRLRAQCLREDSTAQFYAREPMLSALVEQGDGNRMAFEYLVGWYLLTGQLPKVVQAIERLDEFGYAEFPRLWQEAILIYSYGTGKPVDLHGRAISPEVHQRIQRFTGVVNRHGKNREAAAAELARDFRGSYFFYYFCTVVARR